MGSDPCNGGGVRREVDVLFRNVGAQLFDPTVEDENAFGPLKTRDPAGDVRRIVQESLDRFGSRGLAGRLPFALSGGEKKKAVLASMLAVEPDVLLLDARTAGLDPRSSRILVDLILDAQDRGKRVVASTNHLHVVPEIAERVVVFGEDRRILASGTPEATLQDRAASRAANLIHRHGHAHEGLWHEHEHPGACHDHANEPPSQDRLIAAFVPDVTSA
jgi:cobalt/nickel transport system ATP-binding protein